ncbi:MAG: hypothetical protein HY673_09150 [Chloroflexi bacterium]|nr:hypothetical protein [Chloroflexota bacterium]
MSDISIPSEVRGLASELAKPMPMRRGSVSERYVKCNKPGCPCGERSDARHGPYYSLSRVVRGRTQSRWLGTEQAAVVRQQVEAGQRFRKKIDAYWEACEQWADAQLAGTGEVSTEETKKGALKKPSKRRSSPKSGSW